VLSVAKFAKNSWQYARVKHGQGFLRLDKLEVLDVDSFQITVNINSPFAFARDLLTKLLKHSNQIFLLMLFSSGSEHVIYHDPTKWISQVIIILGLSNSMLRLRSLGSGLGHLRVKLIEVSAKLTERCIN